MQEQCRSGVIICTPEADGVTVLRQNDNGKTVEKPVYRIAIWGGFEEERDKKLINVNF